MTTNYSFAFLPYLKTTETVHFKNLVFRRTDDKEIPEDAAQHLEILKQMFFLRDHLRIQQLSYAILPRIGDELDAQTSLQLREFQTILAYLYSAPHPASGDPFLTFEHASIFLATPKRVSIYLLEDEHNVENIVPDLYPMPDDRKEVEGYEVLINFKTHSWVTKGSRIYPPAGRLWLNISQNLAFDLNNIGFGSRAFPLIRFFNSDTRMPHLHKRIITALTWYNRSLTVDIDEEVSLVNLAVAFESLLDLEQGERVTNRFKESVNLLLGGMPRLDSWLIQFYNARSQILHEGYSPNLRFLATDDLSKKSKDPMPVYSSLVSYGHQVFQLCVATILSGALMADELGISVRLYTNQQRFEKVCKILNSREGTPEERILAASQDITEINTHRFTSETGLKIETIIGAARLVTNCYLETSPSIDSTLHDLLKKFTESKKEVDHFDALSKLMDAQEYYKSINPDEGSILKVTLSLLDTVWHYTFMHYFWLRENRLKSEPEGSS